MKPYFEAYGQTIYHGDCRDVLPSLPQDSIDVVVTDPPYGMKWQSANRTLKFDVLQGDESTDAGRIGIGLCIPLLRRGRHIYAFGRYDLTGLGVAGPAELIWDKQIFSAGDLTIPCGKQHEHIEFYVNNKDGKLNKSPDGALTTRVRRGSILRVQRLNASEVNRHPTEKPIDLIRQLIESSSVLYETVLDPFLGSGTTLVAAMLEGRNGIGIEIEERYCEVAASRLSQGSLMQAFA